ncbi:MAG: hypothetical protein ACO3QA_10570, partial [Phycisphaerales bacterium]
LGEATTPTAFKPDRHFSRIPSMTAASCCCLDASRRLIGLHRIHEVPTEIALDEIDAAAAA